MAERGVLDELLDELKKDIKVRLLDRLVKEDLSKYDKLLRKAVDEVFAEIRDEHLQEEKDGRNNPWSSVRNAVSSGISEWAEKRVEEMLRDPKQQKALEEMFKPLLQSALTKYANEVRFEVSVGRRYGT